MGTKKDLNMQQTDSKGNRYKSKNYKIGTRLTEKKWVRNKVVMAPFQLIRGVPTWSGLGDVRGEGRLCPGD